MKDYGCICLEFCSEELETLEKLTGIIIPPDDDADARHALHALIEDYAKIKGVEIPDLAKAHDRFEEYVPYFVPYCSTCMYANETEGDYCINCIKGMGLPKTDFVEG